MKKIVYWTPRVLAILFTLFIMMFSLDVFDATSSLTDQLIGFFMHNLPAYGIILVIVFAWKKDIIGMIGFALIAIGLFMMVMGSNQPSGSAVNPAVFIVSGPALLISLLYGFSWILHKKH